MRLECECEGADMSAFLQASTMCQSIITHRITSILAMEWFSNGTVASNFFIRRIIPISNLCQNLLKVIFSPWLVWSVVPCTKVGAIYGEVGASDQWRVVPCIPVGALWRSVGK